MKGLHVHRSKTCAVEGGENFEGVNHSEERTLSSNPNCALHVQFLQLAGLFVQSSVERSRNAQQSERVVDTSLEILYA